nr:unnamed protein product [Callosobruchus analis]
MKISKQAIVPCQKFVKPWSRRFEITSKSRDTMHISNPITSGELDFFNVQHQWLILTSTQNFSYLFDKVTMFINSDITVAYPSEGNTGEKNYVIEEVYNPAEGKGGHLNRRVLGTFNVSHGYKAREKRCKYWVRRNMTGVLLKTTVVKDHRYAKIMGYLKKDGTFDGLVGQLQRKQVDYGSSPLFVRVDRSTVMESAFIFRQPKVKGSADVFLKPLSTSIWILTLVAAALMVTALKLSHTGEKMAEHLGKSIENSWSLFVINAVAAFCQQGIFF